MYFIKRVTILLIGKTGNGKSALGNFLLNNECFKESPSCESETHVTTMETNYYDNIRVIDTPGINDSEGRDQEHYENIIRFIKDTNINSILMVLNYNEPKFSSDLQEILKIYCNIFNFDFFQHFGLVFSKAYVSKSKLEKSKPIKRYEFQTKFKEIIEDFYNQKLYYDIPCFFIDSNLEEPKDIFLEERKNIISWAKKFSTLDTSNSSIKKDLKIKLEEIDYKTDYDVDIDGNYKIQKWDYYRRTIKTDIHGRKIYGDWNWYDSSRNRYKYRSSCMIF